MRVFFDYTDSGGPAFLASRRPCFVGELFTFSLAQGGGYLWTSYQSSLTLGASTWLAASPVGAPLITRNRFGVKNTVEVPELELRLGSPDSLYFGNLKNQIHNGLFDGATVAMDRVFMPVPGDLRYGRVNLFTGRLSGVTIDSEGITVTSKGHNVLMNQQAPRNLYQTNCLHTFCDAGCAITGGEAAFTFTGQVCAPGTTAGGITWTVPAGFTASQFTHGKVTMTSGAASGQIRTVRLAGGVSLAFAYPLYDAPSAGDTFSILMGCDRQLNATTSSCEQHRNTSNTLVNNLQHYRGFPFVPQAELAV